MKIAIAGKMCSGKTTIANMVMQQDNNYQKVSFAGKIKELAVELFDMKEKNRDLLITMGNKFKEIDENVWANYVIKNTKCGNYVLDDLRFQNELDMLIKNGWFIINLEVDHNEQEKRIRKLYPSNYEMHLKNRSDISEIINLDFSRLDSKYLLHINTSKESYASIKHKIHLLMIKNN